MKHIFISMLVCFAILSPNQATAFDDKRTHPKISEEAIAISKMHGYLQYDLSLEKYEIDQQVDTLFNGNLISHLIKEGSSLEDTPACRASNHFHNPLLNWSESGLTDTLWIVNAYCAFGDYPASEISSNITWATGYINPSEKKNEVMDANPYDWESARGYFYTYLTGKDYKTDNLIALDQTSRELYMMDCFRSLGQVMHLLQDSAVPAHVRNDFAQGHTKIKWTSSAWFSIGNPFELYVKDNYRSHPLWFVSSIRSNFSDPFLTKFWDNEQVLDATYSGGDMGNLGMAEYTNLNFLSAFTMFTDDLPFPKAEHCAIVFETAPLGIPDLDRQYISSANGHPGEQVNRLAVVSMTYHFRKKYFPSISNEHLPVYINDDCYEEYAEKLIPRAIGYSAGLLNYFFRGKLSIDGASFQRNGSGDIVELTVEVKNTSNLGGQPELMKTGGFALACEYAHPTDGESFQLKENIYPILDETNLINSEYVTLTIILDQAIPKEATDLKFTLVFRGTLGSEPDAVVARVVPDSKSAIAFSYQPGGPGNESNIFTIFPNAEGEMQITDASDGLPYDFDPAWSADGTMLAFDTHEGNSFNKIIKIIDLTSEVPFPGNVITTLDSGGEDYHDTSPSFSPDGTKIVAVRSGPEFDELIIFDIDSGSWDTLNVQADWLLYPKWSPTGDKIAYVNFPDYSSPGDIYLINPDGSGNVNITNNDALDTYPAWSPDGQQIVFASDRDGEPDGNGEIWSMDITGENPIPTMISNGDYGCSYPSFSPDMQQIVFSDLGNLFIVDVDGSNIRCIVANGYSTIGSTWSPAFMAPEVVSFSASPVTINAGDSVTLSWEVNRAASCEIEPGGVGLTTEGTLNVSPGQTTTYTLIAKGPLRETVRATVTVTVNP